MTATRMRGGFKGMAGSICAQRGRDKEEGRRFWYGSNGCEYSLQFYGAIRVMGLSRGRYHARRKSCIVDGTASLQLHACRPGLLIALCRVL